MSGATRPGPVLQAQGLTVGYAPCRRPWREVLRDVEVSLQAGEFVCLLGPNGTGKSTLLRTLAGMHRPLAGTVRLLGDDVTHLRPAELARRLSVVLTDRVDVGVLRAADVVALGRHPHTGWSGRLGSDDVAAVDAALAATGATELAGRDVGELSDGERQRVMIARAVAQEPAVLLLDEPTAFLDAARRVEITALLRGLARDSGRAVLCSTHDLDLALRSADAVWLAGRDGTLVAGAPEDLVLDGTLARSFAVDGLSFDAELGTFMLAVASCGRRGRVRVTGSGVAADWTTRALERVGFEVVSSPPVDLEVELVDGVDGLRWRTGAGGDGSGPDADSLGELLA